MKPSSAALIAAASIVAAATLIPVGQVPPFFQLRLEPADVVVNLLLFIPVGAVLACQGRRWQTIILISLLGSSLIELSQGWLITGRRGSPADVIANVGGAVLGVALMAAVARARSPAARTGLAVVLSLPLLAWIAGFLALSAEPPAGTTWYSQWAHHFFDTEPFGGRVLEVRFQGQVVPDGYLRGVDAFRASIASGGIALELRIISDGPTRGVTHLASIVNLRGRGVIGIDQLGEDLSLYWTSRGNRLGLRSPRLRFRGAGQASRGEELVIRAQVRNRLASLVVNRGATRMADSVRLTPLAGWRSFIPSRELSRRSQRLFDLIWTLGLAGYLVVAGWLISRTGRSPTGSSC